MSLLFNTLSSFVIVFLPRSKHILILAAVTVCSDFGVQKNKVCHHFYLFPPIWHENQCVLCLVLIIASWHAYRFPRRQVWWSLISISVRIFQFVVIHSVKGFNIVNEAGLPSWLSGKETACQCRRHGLHQEDTLEKEMATHSSILTWEIS